MIIDYDHNPALSVDQKLQSLKESMQMAVDELTDTIKKLKEEITELRSEAGE